MLHAAPVGEGEESSRIFFCASLPDCAMQCAEMSGGFGLIHNLTIVRLTGPRYKRPPRVCVEAELADEMEQAALWDREQRAVTLCALHRHLSLSSVATLEDSSSEEDAIAVQDSDRMITETAAAGESVRPFPQLPQQPRQPARPKAGPAPRAKGGLLLVGSLAMK